MKFRFPSSEFRAAARRARAQGRKAVPFVMEAGGVGGLSYAAWAGIAPEVGITLASVYLVILANIRR